MGQLFHPVTNVLSKAAVFGFLLVVAFVFWVLGVVYRSSYVTGVHVARAQPVPFSHAHHVGGLGLDCRYCHAFVETGRFAGLPPTQTCMNCHAQVWADSPVLQPVRDSWRTGLPIAWSRVHNLPDFAYFDHSIHVAKGVACVTCHGRVDRMPLTWKTASLFMEWCMRCHRNPEPYAGPRAAVFAPGNETDSLIRAGNKSDSLIRDRNESDSLIRDGDPAPDIRRRTDCIVCHR